MEIFCLIFFLVVSALCFFANEYETLYGVYRPTCVVRRSYLGIMVLILLIISLKFSGSGDVRDSVMTVFGYRSPDSVSLMVILLAALVSILVLKNLSINGSITYSFLGALAAFCIIQPDVPRMEWNFVLSIAAAPLMAMVLSFIIRGLLKFVFSRVKVHMITLSFYMRHAVILSIILTTVALGLNWGGMLSGVGDIIAVQGGIGLISAVVVGASMVLIVHVGRNTEDDVSGLFADFSIYAVVSVGFSVVLTMLFFSFKGTTSAVGLSPVPLSVSSLVFAAVSGAEIAQRSRLVDDREYIKEGAAVIAAPAMSFALAYALLYIIDSNKGDGMVVFVVLSMAVVAMMLLLFASYVRRQKRATAATDRLVYVQQQQIYEHSRALTDMELKVVLSENQALHNAVEMKRQEVMNVALSMVEQREYLESLNEIVDKLSRSENEDEKSGLVSELRSSLKQRLSYDRDVDSQYFYAQAESLHEDFNAKLSENYPNLTQQEKRLATLLRLGFSSKYIATLMKITPKSVEISRYRLRQKLGLGRGDNLVNFIKSI